MPDPPAEPNSPLRPTLSYAAPAPSRRSFRDASTSGSKGPQEPGLRGRRTARAPPLWEGWVARRDTAAAGGWHSRASWCGGAGGRIAYYQLHAHQSVWTVIAFPSFDSPLSERHRHPVKTRERRRAAAAAQNKGLPRGGHGGLWGPMGGPQSALEETVQWGQRRICLLAATGGREHPAQPGPQGFPRCQAGGPPGPSLSPRAFALPFLCWDYPFRHLQGPLASKSLFVSPREQP